MDFLSSISDFDLDSSPVYDDVSYGAPAMETSTPTGNGTGEFNWGGLLGGALAAGVQYAIQRDQQKMNMTMQMGQPTTQQQVQVQGRQTNFMFIAGCGLVLYLVLANGGGK